jgi:GT2 family glycosyltransferase
MPRSPLSKGNFAFRNKDYEAAIRHYTLALKKHPELARILQRNIELACRRGYSVKTSPYIMQPTNVDIVVPVHNALEDVKKCLDSLHSCTDEACVRVIVVNDGSDQVTTDWLREYCSERHTFQLIEHESNVGYTKAINTGLREAKAEYIITQNSDTIVTNGWLRGLVRCMQSDPKIGIVGPLSNAASWQSVPNLRDKSGSFAINVIPENLSIEDMAHAVVQASERHYPRLPFVNGFCFMIRRAVIDAIGYMDDENFPVGYGEENDFCIRAMNAGYELALADDVYVFHAKSKSFGHERRKALSVQGTLNLKRKHGEKKYDQYVNAIRYSKELDAIRARIVQALENRNTKIEVDIISMRILFLLPVKGGGGGAHSVVQEVSEMRRLGLHAQVGVKHEHLANFEKSYADIESASQIFIGFDDHSLIDISAGYDIVVGTIFTSMQLVKRIVEARPHIMPAYYVQDYEPNFFQKGSVKWQEARESYTLVRGAFLFAKTEWIIGEVKREHGVTVHKVKPSIDHQVYKPVCRSVGDRISISAMIRPQTPRRGAARTMRLLSRLHEQFGERLTIHIFGCENEHPDFQSLERSFPFVNHGSLKRPQVASLLAKSHLFIDLSDYQAFGRTALEAMACGCAAVVPSAGGACEYAINQKNSLVLDTLDEASCFSAIFKLLKQYENLELMCREGLITAAGYSVHSAAVSELVQLNAALNVWRRQAAHHT